MRKAGAKSVTFLRAGNPAALAELRAALPELSPPDSLGLLWRVFDGAESDGEMLDDLWLDGTFFFFSVAEAIEDYRVCEDLWASDETFKDYWPVGFLPIATPGDGSRLLVDCVTGSPTHGNVFELFHGIGVSRSAASIDAYFIMARAWLDQGAVSLMDDGKLDVDHKRASEIARQLNPGFESWADETGSDQ